jgi:O-antigen ligase
MKKSNAVITPFPNIICAATVTVGIVLFIVWQGAYFPSQFLLILVLLIVAFIVRSKTLSLSREVAFLFGVALLLFVSLMFRADNTYAGLTECLRFLVMPCTLLFFINSNAKLNKRAIFVGLMFVAILGLLSYVGIIVIPSGVIASSGRLQSTLQYANTTALLMLIGTLYAVQAFITSHKVRYVVCAIICTATLVLTGSRTTFIIAIASWVVFVFISASKRGKVITALYALVAIIVVLFLTTIPGVRLFRISLTEPTLVERYVTYSDALIMLKEKWLLGIGVGNWQTQQFVYQSAPYNVKYIHNYYLQLFLDGGILAPIIFIATLIPAVIRGLKSERLHAVILVTILVHALLDFDLNFAAIGAIAMFSLSQLVSTFRTVKIGKLRCIAIAPLFIIAVLCLSEMLSMNAGEQLKRGELGTAMSEYKSAYALNPLNHELLYQMAQATHDIALTENLIREAIAGNPDDLNSIAILTRISVVNADYSETIALAETLIEKRRFSVEYQNLFIEVLTQAVKADAITGEEISSKLRILDERTANVNPLYARYIQKEGS